MSIYTILTAGPCRGEKAGGGSEGSRLWDYLVYLEGPELRSPIPRSGPAAYKTEQQNDENKTIREWWIRTKRRKKSEKKSEEHREDKETELRQE